LFDIGSGFCDVGYFVFADRHLGDCDPEFSGQRRHVCVF